VTALNWLARFSARHTAPPASPGSFRPDIYELAHAIKVPRSRANDIVRGRRALTTDTAIRLGRYFGTTPEFWINLQARYDLDVADRTVRRRIEQEVPPRAA
jgi:addiction module HigA family antidote